MSKPVGYYASDRDGFFDDLVDRYGNQLQRVSITDKLFMISAIAQCISWTAVWQTRSAF
jgi:hypothetical protein